MEPLIGALSGLAVAITALGGVLWRLQHNNHTNGQHQTVELQLLRDIKALLETDIQDRQGMRRDLTESLAYLRGRLQ